VVFDEIHQLRDPSRVLKIAADEFPKLRVLATGSSTLAASKKFRDTLTGRKRLLHLVPVLAGEYAAFGATLEKRLYHGGLPPALLAATKQPSFYREWLDSFFARDIQRLFAFRDINRFNALFEYVLRQSGGQLEVTKTASALGISRPTVESHLQALEITQALTLVRPFHGGGQGEIVRQPKAYAFDTGFVSFARGWDPLRAADKGLLWEHLVVEAFQARWPDDPVRYWRDKAGNEVDFVRSQGREAVDAYECKWSPDEFDPTALKVFRGYYPKGKNYLLTPLSGRSYVKQVKGLELTVAGLDKLDP
jgi:predicted AAA+ superfamily ATPase